MRRYWVGEDLSYLKTYSISGENFKHIFGVCRRKEGDAFELLSDRQAFLVKVLSVKKKEAEVSIKEVRLLPKLKTPHIHLVLSFSQPKVIDKVLEKSVELGVKSIQLVALKNSFLKKKTLIEQKKNRLEKIKKSAMQQSGRGEDLVLKPSCTLVEFLDEYKNLRRDSAQPLGVFFYEGEARRMSEWLELSHNNSELRDVYVFIGSEGGFTDSEASLIEEAGFLKCTLGEQILRVETACTASISILKSKLDLW